MKTTNFFLSFFVFLYQSIGFCVAVNQSAIPVKFGLILNMSCPVGKMSSLCVSMALEDFYSEGNHAKRLVLRLRDSQEDSLAAASAALDLLKKEEVEAIVGPQNSGETDFVANLGGKAQVPTISFSATSPLLSSMKTPYFIRGAQNDAAQVGAIADIFKSTEWRRVVLVYEDNDYGRGMIPSLADAFQGIGVITTYRSDIPPSASDLYIERELYKMMTMQTRVFVVHMGSVLGAQFFRLVHKLGMMSTGYAWIVTNGVGNLLGNMDPSLIGSMRGVIGLQTHVPRSKKLDDFKVRWMSKSNNSSLNVYGLWAYDTIWALALAAESSDAGKSKYRYSNGSANSSDPFTFGVSPTGAGLLKAILSSNFKGLSGDFRLAGGELQATTFQLVNLVGKGKFNIVGYWDSIHRLRNLAGESNLGSVTWPGGGSEAPKGWVTPTNGKTLKILVPMKDGFSEFVNVQDSAPKVTGYSIDVFKDVVKALPYALPYEFVPYGNKSGDNDWPYDVLIDQIYKKMYDGLVGDVTIIGNRSKYVDFTLPYSDSGVSMIVPVKATNRKKAGVFLEPLTPQLWGVSAAFFVFTGIVIWALEHRINPNFRGPPSEQIGLIFYYAFSTMVFAHNERLASNLARVVVVIWVFVVLILTSSYTASLASILTVQQFQPEATDLQALINQGQKIGYQSGSFVKDMLKMKNARDEQVVALSTDQEYADALLNETVAAIVDEIPYIKVFLSKHCRGFMIVGPTYKTDGFGFVFPKGSPLVSDVSSAILNVTEGESMSKIERSWLGSQTTCADAQDQLTSNRLPLYSFRGLFLLTGTVSLGAVIIFFFLFVLDYLKSNAPRRQGFWQTTLSVVKHFDTKDLSSNTFRKETQKTTGTMRRNSSKVHDVPIEDHDLQNESHGSPTVTPSSLEAEGNQVPDQEIREENTSVHEGYIQLVAQR
ncbi:glutamate receptor 2.7-like [Nymphaea colorata]|nr:glutamate receptor 2.7-like [Nymphaea colorata]